MFGIDGLLVHMKEQFPDNFPEARQRTAQQPFDVNGFRLSDLLIVPAGLKKPSLSGTVKQYRDRNIDLIEKYIAIISFSRPIDAARTVRSLINAMINYPGAVIEVTGVSTNPQSILKIIFDKSSAAENYTLFAVKFTMKTFLINTKENCGICYTDC